MKLRKESSKGFLWFPAKSILLDLSKDRLQTLLMPRFDMPLFVMMQLERGSACYTLQAPSNITHKLICTGELNMGSSPFFQANPG